MPFMFILNDMSSDAFFMLTPSRLIIFPQQQLPSKFDISHLKAPTFDDK